MPQLRFPDHALVLQMVEHCIATGRPLMLAHDEGVYLCADGLRTDAGFRMKCAYAEGCDPTLDAEWFETARQLVGGDDFGMRFNLGDGAALLAALRRGDRLVVSFNKRFVSLFTERVMPHPTTTPSARGRGLASPSTARERINDMATKMKKAPNKKKSKSAPKSVERLTREARAEIAGRLAGGKQDHEVPTAKEIANTPKAAKPPKSEKPKAPKRMSALDAAADVLEETKRPMNCTELVMEMDQRGLWSSPNGKTPAATLYAAVLREINAKGKDARFKKMDRGQFAATNGKAD